MGLLIHIVSYGFIRCFLCLLLSFILLGSAYCFLSYYLVVLITIHTLLFSDVDELIMALVFATMCYFTLDSINQCSNWSVENIPKSSLA